MSRSVTAFSELLSYFTKCELPLTIQYSDQHQFSKSNDDLPDSLLQQFIFPNLDFEVDEFTEFLPCIQFESVKGVHTLILWMVRLMRYLFYLLNFDEQGRFLHLQEIAGFYSEDDQLINKMAHIDVTGHIYILEGTLDESHHEVNPVHTKKWMLEFLPDGTLRKSEVNLEL